MDVCLRAEPEGQSSRTDTILDLDEDDQDMKSGDGTSSNLKKPIDADPFLGF